MRGDLLLIACFALLKLLIHLFYNRYYGYHLDELYFLSCGRHLSFGYVDHGPWVPWMARLSEELFGDSLSALRLIPALTGSLSLFIVGWMTRALGGGRFAITLACLGYLIAPVFLLPGNILSLPSFEPFFWGLSALLLIRLIQMRNYRLLETTSAMDSRLRGNDETNDTLRKSSFPRRRESTASSLLRFLFQNDKRLWLWIGVVVGFGLLNKHSMVFFIAGLFVGILATPLRKDLLTPWPWGGLGIAFLIFSPNLWWQIRNGWPTLEFLTALNRGTMSRIPLQEFLLGQVLYVHPTNALLWVTGLCYFLFNRRAVSPEAGPGSRYRLLAWIYLTVLAILVVAKGKIYYLGPAYPMLIAGGGVSVEGFIQRRNLRSLKIILPILFVIGGLIVAPVGLPILPIEKLDGYVRATSLGALKNSYELTGVFHDQFGWKEKASLVAEVYHGLPEEEREECVILARHYGEAGAVDLYGPALGLPPAVCGHLTYFLWGPGPKEGKIAVTLGISGEELRRLYEEVTLVKVISYEEPTQGNRRTPVHLCRKPRMTLQEVWPRLREGAFD